jgi:hypothetical protein
MTSQELIDFEWFTDQGSKLAVMATSKQPALVTIAGDAMPVLLAEYTARLPGVADAGRKARAQRLNDIEVMMAKEGPPLWTEWHQRALAFDPSKTAEELQWITTDFYPRIPCGDCKVSFNEILKRTPPDLTSAASYFASTVEVHNQVNAKWNRQWPQAIPQKTIWTIGQAELFWKKV